MTRKDYRLIAGVIRDSGLDYWSRKALAEAFCDALSPFNMRFQPSKFLMLAGVKGYGDND